jgi:hypothetical protein
MSKLKSTKYLMDCMLLTLLWWVVNISLLSIVWLNGWGQLFILTQIVSLVTLALLGIKALRDEGEV